jgi:hypothetical protein
MNGSGCGYKRKKNGSGLPQLPDRLRRRDDQRAEPLSLADAQREQHN